MLDNYLEHYGKKGMRWGTRKGRAAKKTPGTRNYQTSKLSNQELKKVISRMELEQRYTELNKKGSVKGKGLDATKKFLASNGNTIAKTVVGAVATASIAAFLQSPKAKTQLSKLSKIT